MQAMHAAIGVQVWGECNACILRSRQLASATMIQGSARGCAGLALATESLLLALHCDGGLYYSATTSGGARQPPSRRAGTGACRCNMLAWERQAGGCLSLRARLPASLRHSRRSVAARLAVPAAPPQPPQTPAAACPPPCSGILCCCDPSPPLCLHQHAAMTPLHLEAAPSPTTTASP